jgi:spore coat protein U-like protein
MTKNKSKKSFLKTYAPILLFVFFSAAAAGLWYFAPKAFANTTSPATASLTVTASVAPACTVTAATLAFPTTPGYDPTSGNPQNGSTTTIITCTSGSTVSMYIAPSANAGKVSGDTYAMAGLTTNTVYLGYNLYEDSADTTPWPTAAPGLTIPACSTSTTTDCYNAPGATDPTNIYGQIPASQPVSVQQYSDTDTLNVVF